MFLRLYIPWSMEAYHDCLRCALFASTPRRDELAREKAALSRIAIGLQMFRGAPIGC